MPVFLVTSPDGQKFRVTGPEGSTQEQAIEYIQSQMASMSMEQKPKPQEGITAALTGGFKRALSTGETALESLIDPELAAQRGAERSQQIGEQYAPGASLEKVKQAYEQKGLFPAIREGISQIPAALAEQSPQIAATLGGARLGALAGSAVAPGLGTVIGGVAGAAVPSLVQLYGSNLERQAEEKAPISRAGAFGAAVPGAALEVASQFIPLGRGLLGKLLGPKADEFLRKGSEEAIERAARESLTTSLTKGAGVGALAEIPTEVAQQMLERYQAGLSLTDEQALKEYGEAAYGAGLVGGPFGAAARGLGRPGARAEFERQQQAEAQRLAVSDEELAQRFPDILPGGFKIEEQELGREMAPAGYSILAEGREEPLSVVDTAEEAQAKLESLTQIREQERAKLLEEDQKIDADVQKAQARLEQLEATEQAGTEEYQTLKADLPRMMDEAAQKKAELFDRVEKLGAPLSVAPIGEVERVNKQFNVVGPDNKPVGAFKTLGEAEAAVKGVVGEDRFTQEKQNRDTARELYKTFVPQMRKFGLGDVGLNIVDRIENGAGGSYLNKLITTSLEEANPIQTMRHESLHAMKDLGFFTPQQWRALEERASKEWIKKYLEGQETEIDGQKMSRLEGYRKLGYSEQDIVEEAIADAFGDYDKGAKPPPGLIAALFRKIKNFFSSLGQALRGAGFQSAEDIFQGIEQGKLKPAKEYKPVTEERLSLRVAKKVGKQLGLEKPQIDSTSIGLQTGKAGVDQFKKKPVGGLPQVVEFLEKRRATSGLKNLEINNEEDREELAKLMAAEAMAAINAGGGALQWYDSVIDSMMNMAALKYQELATNEDNKAALRMAIAIASQGLNVEDNLTFAMSQYDHFRKEGKFKEIGSGADGAAMKSNFILANQMIEQYKLPNFRKFLQTEFTVEELRGAGFDIGGELGDEKVTGSAIFGPKIGFGFYSNLSGNFEPVTMDMWFMRTIGRLSGKLKAFDQKKFDEQIKRFRDAMKESGDNGVFAEEFKDEEIKKAMESVEGAVNLSRIVNSVFNSDFINNRALYDEGARKKTNLVYAAQNIIKSFDAPKDVPQNGTERRLLRDVVARTVDKVAKAYGQRIPPASLQALIWYPEQELYKALGVKLRVTSQDYAGAIRKILKKEGYDESAIDRASKSGSGAVQPVAGQQVQAGVGATGKKPQASFEPSEREEFLEGRREEQVLKQEREAPRRKKVIFEVAPDPNNVELTERWKNLSQKDRLRISNDIAKKIIDQAKKELDFDGRVVSQVGSYLEDTNPSFALFLEKGDAVEISKFIGHALSQDSMMVVSPRPAPGLDKVGAVVIDVKTQSPSEVDAIYQKLRDIRVNGEQPVGGQTTMNNKMIVLNYSGLDTEELAKLVDAKLKGVYDVQYTDVYSAFPEKKDYDYADPQNDPRGKGKTVRERSRALRAEATKLLEKELGAEVKGPAEKLSLKNVRFPTVKEAKEAVKAAGTPNTEAFKLFNAGNQWVDADGKPKVFYHATARDFFEFTPAGQSQAIFLAETPEEAETFGSIAEDKLRREVYSALGLKEDKLKFLQGVVDRAVEKGTITKKEGDEFMKQANRKTPAYGDFGDIEQDVYDALIELSPTRMSIMPLYARAMAPFDFENKEHVDQVMNWVANNTQYPQDFPEKWLNGMKGRISQGLWQAIEDKRVQQAIRALGFDAFTVRENRASAKNYAVYKPNQVKSVTGNDGQFSLESKDIRYSLSRAAYTPERVDQLLGRYAYTQNDAENDTKAYVARVSPKDFLNATTTRDGMERIREESTPLDTDRLMKESQPIMLLVQQGKVGNTDVWEITGHEGRHRMMALADAGYDSVPVVFDFGRRVSNAKPVDMKYVVRQNFGGEIGKAISDFTVSDAIPVSYGQEKALRGFEETKGIKFSLPTLSAATQNRLNEVTPQRYEPTFKDRVIGAFKQDFTSLRQKFLNRYEALAVLDRRLREQMRQSGGPALLADQSAEFAALQSDLAAGVTASAMGIGDRQGGIPVYKNGFTTIDTSVKGLTEALAPLAKYGDPEIYQRYQFWAGWKRGRRLLREGREQVYTPADAKLAQEIEAKHPEFVQVQKDLVAFNNGIVNFAVQTGVLSRERAQVYTKYADYIPFYRQLDLDKTIGPNPFSGISGLRGPKELKGGEAPLGDFMENLVRNTQSMINAGMKNAAAQKATKVALQLKNVMVERLPGPAKGVGYDVYTVLENGELVYYRSADPLFIDALKSLNMPDLPFMGLLSAPANVLRNLVTKDPGFMMANLLRDSLSSYVTSGQNVTPIVGTMVNFGKALSGKDKNLQTLFNAGVIGGYEFSQNVEQSGKSLSADLNKKAGKDAKLLRPFKSLWEGLEKGTTASDAATRMAVYERVMKETGNEAEAISRALEVMNFNRKGNSILIRIATAALPFFNARLQGLDLFYRASTGRMDTQDAKEIKRKFWVRGMTMAALSAMYYMSVAGDDDYEEQEKETKENNWIIPSLGIRIPIPFEVGTLFKTMPETITAYWMGKATGEDLMGTTKRALMNTFAFNPFPQTFRPLYEVITNYNFFTGREIVGQDLKDVEPRYQIGPRTSKFAEILGDQLNVSPLKLDQLIKGYTGTIGGYVTFAVDSIISEFSDVPKASRRFEQMPIVSRFALDPEARGKVTQFYELGQSVDTVVRTMSLLEKTARPEEYAKFLQDNIGVLAVKDNVRSIEKAMKELRDTKRMINNLDMPPDEKRDLLTDLGRAEKNLVVNIGELRRVVSELK
jgi:hypothetical protein